MLVTRAELIAFEKAGQVPAAGISRQAWRVPTDKNRRHLRISTRSALARTERSRGRSNRARSSKKPSMRSTKTPQCCSPIQPFFRPALSAHPPAPTPMPPHSLHQNCRRLSCSITFKQSKSAFTAAAIAAGVRARSISICCYGQEVG